MDTELEGKVFNLYIEEGSTVSASGAVVPVWCVMRDDTHEQIGESYSTREDAEEARELARFMLRHVLNILIEDAIKWRAEIKS